MASSTPVCVPHQPDSDSPSPSGPPFMCLHNSALQGPSPTLASILKHSDASPCVFDDISFLPVSCTANHCDMDSLSPLDSLRLTLTRITSPGGTPHRSLPPGPSRTDPEPWALQARPDVASATSKCNGNEEIGEGKHLLGVLEGKVEQELGTSRIAAREQTSPFANHCDPAPASPPQVPSTQTLLGSSMSPPVAHLLSNMGHTSSPTSAPTRNEATQRAKGPFYLLMQQPVVHRPTQAHLCLWKHNTMHRDVSVTPPLPPLA